MARRKLWASTTFEILPLSTCTLWQQKSYTSKGIQSIFEIFAWARRCWGWALGWKCFRFAGFYFCNGKVKILRIENIWNFATFNLFTVPAKIPYLQKFSIDIRNLCLRSKMLRVGIWVESFRCGGILFLQWQGENFAHRQHLKFCHFQLVHFGSKNPISPKVFKWSSKSFPELEDFEGGHFGGKFQVRRCFTFVMARWKLWASTTFEFLPLSTCTLYTVAAKILYLQKYSTDFRNLCLSSKMLRVGIWMESLTCSGSLLLQWQDENFGHRKHLNFCHFQPVHCASKNPISPKVFNRFSKSLPQFENL